MFCAVTKRRRHFHFRFPVAEPGVPGPGRGGGQPGPSLRRDFTYRDANGDRTRAPAPGPGGGVSNRGWRSVSPGKGESPVFYIFGALQVKGRGKRHQRKRRKKTRQVPGERLGRGHRGKPYLFPLLRVSSTDTPSPPPRAGTALWALTTRRSGCPVPSGGSGLAGPPLSLLGSYEAVRFTKM